ncbi:sigma-54 dependent transcriptional regulator [Amphritea sp. 1_MG-2023]|uniref:sigma-54-dependent transcriptional regulator n=1 Tax=Amphritea sp. 1_MG-2023 TaxID=3062670 RepID=UPI0026E152F2|nr:sigma-54 dependent transcriptional regulator [Amphritea sp. 1_MG-2023]MDO6563783.1 sigma-54 dependent transcriptional regulator [Amphritea sp. 1_MG-2023]
MVDRTSLNHLLLVEDSQSTAMVYRSYLEADYRVTVVHDGADALAAINDNHFDLLLLDVRLPDMSGLDILRKLRASDHHLPIIMITAHGSVDIAVESIQCGASDFLTKPFDAARLKLTVVNALKERRLSEIVDQYEKTCVRDRFHKMFGAALTMQSVYRIIESAASSRATVFITGESGTGKELCAEAVHAESQRADKPYVALNCAAIPRDLLESEIFGHIKGAFTGALTAREGAASKAAGGTLFLDEIGEMPMELQSKLLRFIQSGTFQPVGSSREVSVDIRFICATNRDPLEEVRAGRFREDLYYRLHVIPIVMPPLRERGRDCLLIANEMLAEYSADEDKSFSGFTAEVAQIFLNYRWPGNVRELSNVVRNIVVLNDAEHVSVDMLPAPLNTLNLDDNQANVVPPLTRATDAPPVDPDARASRTRESDTIEPLWLAEKRIIERAIAQCQGNVPRAAAFLEISASTIYRKKQQWEQNAG